MMRNIYGLIASGNWMLWDGSLHQLKPHHIPENWQEEGIGGRWEDVPLTDEVLTAVGFGQKEEGKIEGEMAYWVKDAVCLFYNENPPKNTFLSGFCEVKMGEHRIARWKWIKSLRELQNTYFILCQKSLNVDVDAVKEALEALE